MYLDPVISRHSDYEHHRQTRCKNARARYAADPEKHRTKEKTARSRQDPIERMVRKVLIRAQNKEMKPIYEDGARRVRRLDKGLVASLIQSLSPAPTHCPILGIVLDYFGPPRSGNSASIDRVDNSLGYVTGNVAIISYRANSIKNSGSAEDHEANRSLDAFPEQIMKDARGHGSDAHSAGVRAVGQPIKRPAILQTLAGHGFGNPTKMSGALQGATSLRPGPNTDLGRLHANLTVDGWRATDRDMSPHPDVRTYDHPNSKEAITIYHRGGQASGAMIDKRD